MKVLLFSRVLWLKVEGKSKFMSIGIKVPGVNEHTESSFKVWAKLFFFKKKRKEIQLIFIHRFYMDFGFEEKKKCFTFWEYPTPTFPDESTFPLREESLSILKAPPNSIKRFLSLVPQVV